MKFSGLIIILMLASSCKLHYGNSVSFYNPSDDSVPSRQEIAKKFDVMMCFTVLYPEEDKIKVAKGYSRAFADRKCGFKKDFDLINVQSKRFNIKNDVCNHIAANIKCKN